MPDKINIKYLQGKSTEDLLKILPQVESNYRFVQNGSPEQPGYKRAPYTLKKGNPNPKQLRKTIARIKTILNERRRREEYWSRHPGVPT